MSLRLDPGLAPYELYSTLFVICYQEGSQKDESTQCARLFKSVYPIIAELLRS